LEPEDFAFDWDPAKREINLQKHDIDFRDAIAVFEDAQHMLENTTRPEHGERRTKVIGRAGALLICVIFTDRGEVRRIISARRASRNERERYRQSAESA
jgi:uncharacterized DUF497 family protein